MKEGFEDKFMEAQTSLVSLGLELLSNAGREADKLYIYILQNEDEFYIEPFFALNGDIYTQNDWFSPYEILDFVGCGIEDIENILDICQEYEAECPHEFRLIYDVKKNSLDTNYNYENVTQVYDKDVTVIVKEWIEECIQEANK